MSTNKLKPEQIKAFKEKEAEVFKADEDGFIDIRNIEWFADEVFAAGDNQWGLAILKKIEGLAENFYDLEGIMERLKKLNENDLLLALVKKAEPMIETEDYGVSGCYLLAGNFVVSIDKDYARELYKKSEDHAVDFNEFNELSGSLANDSDDKENALKIVQLRCIPLIDEKDHPNRLSQSAQVVRTLIDLGEIQEDNEGTNFNHSIQILADYRKKNNL
ncbi:hypothetical protein OAM52_04835 [Flavobacteriaceae bacterium]|nr:hypothetical protein [Flavobacteriaceae bacterium]